ncbi:hypothetical protein EIP86_000917 [Pleurotus ostreatoroseus]|nr:hypothetical protein EIP86_000917 [Pleurotus ostreatoroseus]
MNSQVTLVEPTALQQDHLLWYFTFDDVHNTTLSSPGDPLTSYVIESDRYASRTKVSRATVGTDPVVVGIIQRNSFFPDKVTLKTTNPRPINEWLKSEPFSSYLPATMNSKDGRFIWRITATEQLCMYELDNAIPIAIFTRSRTQAVDTISPATLALRKGYEPLQDEAVVAMSILEHKRRISEKSTAVLTATAYSGQGYHVSSFI